MKGIAVALAACMLTGALVAAAPGAHAQGGPQGQAEAEMPAGARDVVWARPDGLELLARVFEPPEGTEGPYPVIINVHGGVWNVGDRTGSAIMDAGLADAGFLVVSIDFRDGPDHQHPAASADVTAAVRWVRVNAEELGADPERIGIIGASSGGHLVLVAGLRPTTPEHLGTPIVGVDGEAAAHDDVDGSVSFIGALWPVSDPQARYRYALRTSNEGIANLTEAYFPDEDAMLDASGPRIVTAGGLGDLPPLLVVQSGMDSNIPQEMTFDLLKAYQARDGKVDYAFYPNAGHVFSGRASEDTDDVIALIADYARRRMAP